jgi:hypothetical protein
MSKSYKYLPNKVSKKQRKMIRQRVPLPDVIIYVDEFDHLRYNVKEGYYAVNNDGLWAEYAPSGPDDYLELDIVESPAQQEYLDRRLHLFANQGMTDMPETPPMTPYINHFEEEDNIDQMAPRRKHKRVIRTAVRQRAIQDFADESEGDIGVADSVLSAMDSPYDDFSREEDMDAEIYPEDYEPTPEYFQMAPKRKHIRKNRKTIKKLGGSRRRYKKMN